MSSFNKASHHDIRKIRLSLHYFSSFKPEMQILVVSDNPSLEKKERKKKKGIFKILQGLSIIGKSLSRNELQFVVN